MLGSGDAGLLHFKASTDVGAEASSTSSDQGHSWGSCTDYDGSSIRSEPCDSELDGGGSERPDAPFFAWHIGKNAGNDETTVRVCHLLQDSRQALYHRDTTGGLGAKCCLGKVEKRVINN
jgi:hypothetical protein